MFFDFSQNTTFNNIISKNRLFTEKGVFFVTAQGKLWAIRFEVNVVDDCFVLNKQSFFVFAAWQIDR